MYIPMTTFTGDRVLWARYTPMTTFTGSWGSWHPCPESLGPHLRMHCLRLLSFLVFSFLGVPSPSVVVISFDVSKIKINK